LWFEDECRGWVFVGSWNGKRISWGSPAGFAITLTAAWKSSPRELAINFPD
jgi:hypothetical protein